MNNQSAQKKNIRLLCAAAVLLLLKYIMVVRISESTEFFARTVIFLAVSAAALAVLLFTCYKKTSRFNNIPASVVFIADPLLLLNVFDVWAAVSLIIVLFAVNSLTAVKSKKALILSTVLYISAAVAVNPVAAPSYAAVILCCALISGAFGENEIIKNAKDVTAPVFAGVICAAASFIAGCFIRKGFEFTRIYNIIPYERVGVEQIKTLFANQRSFVELKVALLAVIPLTAACIYYIYFLRTGKTKNKNKDLPFKTKLLTFTLCAAFVCSVAGYVVLGSRQNLSFLIFAPAVLLLSTLNKKNTVFTQTFETLKGGITAHPVAFAAAVIYTAAFFIPFCGSNTLCYQITDFLV